MQARPQLYSFAFRTVVLSVFVGFITIFAFAVQNIIWAIQPQTSRTLSATLSQTPSISKEPPVILIDQGHNNFGNGESLKVMANFLEEHGFATRVLNTPFDEASLKDVDIIYTSNALALENVDNWNIPTPTAFTRQEISRLVGFVNAGGSLLIAIEHMPFGGSYDALATAFGIEVSNGFAVRENDLSAYTERSIEAAGRFLFMRSGGSLANHQVINEHEPYGPIEYLATDTGSAFRLPGESISLITFGPGVISLEPKSSWIFSDETPRLDVAGWSQAGLMNFGAGRAAIIGDNFLTSAPVFLEPPYIEDEDEAVRGAHNHQFTLNLFRWLARIERDSARH